MMKDLQLTKEEAKEQMEPSADNAPKYPWGLCLNLDSAMRPNRYLKPR